jgi:hypothetical protein
MARHGQRIDTLGIAFVEQSDGRIITVSFLRRLGSNEGSLPMASEKRVDAKWYILILLPSCPPRIPLSAATHRGSPTFLLLGVLALMPGGKMLVPER